MQIIESNVGAVEPVGTAGTVGIVENVDTVGSVDTIKSVDTVGSVETVNTEVDTVGSVDMGSPVSLVMTAVMPDPIDASIIAVSIVGGLVGLAAIIVWILGLVRMAKCGGLKNWVFWVSLFGFLFLPGIGSLFGLSMAIAALAVLTPGGGELLGMRHPRSSM